MPVQTRRRGPPRRPVSLLVAAFLLAASGADGAVRRLKAPRESTTPIKPGVSAADEYFHSCDRPDGDPNARIKACSWLLDSRRGDVKVPETYNNRGNAYMRNGDYARAIEDFNAAIDHDPKFVGAFKNRGIARTQRSEFDRAIDDFNRAIGLDANSAPLFHERGRALFNKGEYDLAIRDFDAAIQLDDRYFPAFNSRGLARQKQLDFDRAIEDFETVIALAPNQSAGYNNRAQVLLNDKANFTAAIEGVTTEIKLNPNDWRAYSIRGEAWRLMGNIERALEDHDKAIKLDPKALDAYNNSAVAWRDKGDLDRAIADCETAIRLDPRYDRAYGNRGEFRRLKGDLVNSLRDLDEAVELNPKWPIWRSYRGDTKRLLGDLEGALADYNEAIHILPTAVIAYTGRGLTYQSMGDEARARADYQHALRLSADIDASLARPAQETARQRLAELEAKAVPRPTEIGPPVAAADNDNLVLTFENTLPFTPLDGSSINVNGGTYLVTDVNPSAKTVKVQVLGKTEGGGGLFPGLNRIVSGGFDNFLLYFEGQKLKAFQNPYSSSYAIIAAIDDYERKRDPKNRGPTGYDALDHMVDAAKDLRQALITVGFPPGHVLTFYDEDATKVKLDDALSEFWQGGKYADADRLFFYFGGHGAGDREGAGYLITYDFNQTRPTVSGFLMSDLVERHFRHVSANHFLVALDACSAGLAVPGMRVPRLGEADLKVATLAQIKASVDQRARNLLVAGTGRQQAIAPNGGLFTRTLIDGIKGEADLMRDGVIKFDELAVYMRNKVSAEATSNYHMQQTPASWKDTLNGDGDMLFLLPARR
jgi:tetratricopeptide (TPR) repeat protein